MQGTWRRRFGAALAVVALGTVVLSGCGDDDEEGASPSASASEAPAEDGGGGDTLAVTASDYKFDTDDTLEAGIVTVEFTNEGEKPHEMGLAKLGKELDAKAFGDLLGPVFEGGPFPDDFQGHSGITETEPGESLTSTFTLEPGTYALYCSISDEQEDGDEEAAEGEEGAAEEEAPPHFMLGMYQILEVEGEAGETADLPSDHVITATDYSFDVPELEAGEQDLTFVNDSDEQWHHVVLFVWPEGVDEAEAAEAWKATATLEEGEAPPEGTPEPEDVAGSQVFSPHGGGTFPAELVGGRTYTAVCFIQDQAGGPPHAFAHDMVKHFTVS